jgi:hypothetical protein
MVREVKVKPGRVAAPNSEERLCGPSLRFVFCKGGADC